MAFTLDTTLGTLLDNPTAKNILEKYIPNVSSNPMIGMARSMTLNQILSMPQATQAGLTRDRVQNVLDEINKVIR